MEARLEKEPDEGGDSQNMEAAATLVHDGRNQAIIDQPNGWPDFLPLDEREEKKEISGGDEGVLAIVAG